VNCLKNQAAAEATVEQIRATGAKAIAVQADDVSQEADVLRLFQTVDAELGPISALVNNAGILETQMRVDEMDAVRPAFI
jgi:NAD(P)-dependent dehydrogenase (short-subunit alcohol dehydrogenase family)